MKTSLGHFASKRSVALLTSIFLLTTSGQEAFAADGTKYTDVPIHHWAANAIERLSEYELVQGFNGVYQPNASITRGELAVIIDRIMKFHEETNAVFADLGDAFFTEAVLRAAYAGVILGDGDQVRPLDQVSRQEAVVMLARAFGISPTEGETTFADHANIDPWAKGYINAMQDQGYVQGSDNKFNPTHEISRAEIAQILDALIGKLYVKAGVYKDIVNGNTIINSPDVVLKDAEIKGNLIIAEGVADGDVTLENVVVDGTTIIRGGGDHSIHIKGNSTLGTVVVEKLDSAVRVALTDQAKTDTLHVVEGAEGVKVEIDKEASIETIKTQVNKTIISNQGTVNKMEIEADHVSINTNQTTVSVGEDQAGVTINDKEAQGGSVIEAGSTPGSNTNEHDGNGTVNTSSSGSSSVTIVPTIVQESQSASTPVVESAPLPAPEPVPTPAPVPVPDPVPTPAPTPVPAPEPEPETTPIADPIQIVSVETVTNGRVKLTLNRATDMALTKDNISIICTSGGKDMTVLDVLTTDHMNYDIRTAYYDDNTYSLAIMQGGKVMSEKEFVSTYDCPAITSTEVTRKDAQTAEFTYVSDISGEFYYTISKHEQKNLVWANPVAPVANLIMTVGNSAALNTHRIWTNPEAPTAEQLMQSGTLTAMNNGLNTIQINELDKDTPYTLYYVAKGMDDKVTPVRRISIAAKETAVPAQHHISIVKVEAFDTKATEFTDVHGGFHIQLSNPTEQPLTAESFAISCPGEDHITLGRLETTDNQNYTIYMKEGYMFKDRNTYNVTITFPNQTVATGKTYVDLTEPLLTEVMITRKSADTATVQFTTNEAGFLYWKGLDKSQTSDTSFKDPTTIVEGGNKVAIHEGGNSLELTGLAPNNAVFGYVTEDKLGNQPRTYYYNEIPDAVELPDESQPSQPAEGLAIQEIEVTTEEHVVLGDISALNVTMAQEVSYISYDNILITGNGVNITGYRGIETARYSDSPNAFTVSVKQQLKPGTYTLTVMLDGKTGTKNFTISP